MRDHPHSGFVPPEGHGFEAAEVFPPWKTVALGTRGSVSEYVREFNRAGIEVTGAAREMLQRVRLSERPVQLDLAIVSMAQLFGASAFFTFENIRARAGANGLGPCPSEAALAAMLDLDLPNGTSVVLAMDAMETEHGESLAFLLRRGDRGKRTLDVTFGGPEDEVGGGRRLVFVRLPKDPTHP